MNFKDYHGYKVWDNGVIISKRDKKPMKQQLAPGGYQRVEIAINTKPKKFLLHRLLAIVFLPNIHNKPTVDHKDRNRSNNNLYNLRWATLEEQAENRECKRFYTKGNTNTSGVTGVSHVKKSGGWRALARTISGKIQSRTFRTKEEAIAQRLAWEREYYLK